MNINIRNLGKNDYAQFIKLIDTNVSIENYEKFINNLSSTHIIIIAEYENKIIATGTLLIEPKLTHNICYMGHIENIFVDNEYRNRGVGKDIVQYLKNYAVKYGCYRIDLVCEEKLEKFYGNMGFTKKQLGMTMFIEKNFKI